MSKIKKLLLDLFGKNSRILSITIITAENPLMNKISNKENIIRNIKFCKWLKKYKYDFYQLEGQNKFNENPLVIRNITRNKAVLLGKKFNQKNIIWISMTNKGILAQKIKTHGKPVVCGVSLLSVDKQKISNKEFIIPFTDDVCML